MENQPTTLARYRWPLAIVVLALIPLGAYVFTIRNVTRALSTETLTERFTSGIPEIHSTGVGNLELATVDAVETFNRANKKYTAWGWIYLGESVAQIRVPVTYRYHLQLGDTWKLVEAGSTCTVYAPRIRPSLPPAIHTDKMETQSASGWARSDKHEQLAALERSMTPTLNEQASDSRHIKLAREECRKTVSNFVVKFLLREDKWRSDRLNSIKVIFEDEPPATANAIAPSIQLTP